MEITIKDQVDDALSYLKNNKNEDFVFLSSDQFNLDTFLESNNIYHYCIDNNVNVFWVPFIPTVIIGKTKKSINELRKYIIKEYNVDKNTDMKYVKKIDVYELGISVEYSKTMKWCPFEA